MVGEAGEGDEAVRRSAALRPDVLLMDPRMPVLDGIAATRRLRAEQPEVRVIALTTVDDEDVFAALRAGAARHDLRHPARTRRTPVISACAPHSAPAKPSPTTPAPVARSAGAPSGIASRWSPQCSSA